MDAFELEQIRKEIVNKLNLSKSPRQVLFVLHGYFNLIFSSGNRLFISSFLIEFIEDYISALRSFDPFYTDLEFSGKILDQSAVILKQPELKEYVNVAAGYYLRIKQRREELISFLKGELKPETLSQGIYFPVLEDTSHLGSEISLGIAETVSVTIKNLKSSKNDNFVIVPSSETIEQNLLEQLKVSWNLALQYSRDYVHKINDNHEIVVQFNNRRGEYTGESLGAAMTLAFIEELLRFYNSAYHIKAASNIALTGGISSDGLIKPVSENIIKLKTEVIFFSDITTLVVPAGEEEFALEKLSELQKTYPERSLRIMEAKQFPDIINRRDLVNIRKDNIAVRSGRYAVRNRIPVAIILLLVSAFIYFLFIRYDDNPAIISTRGNHILIENKSGHLLWSKQLSFDTDSRYSFGYIKLASRIVDIDGDGTNEVLLCSEDPESLRDKNQAGRIACFNKNGQSIWTFVFSDTVRSKREILSPSYSISLIDTFSVGSEKLAAVYATNEESFTSATFCLNLKTGRKIGGTLWCSGHNNAAIIKDINNDGKPDIIAEGIDNGFEQVVLYGVSIDELSGYRPSTDQYNILNMNPAKLIFYIRFPKTDYTGYLKLRTESVVPAGLSDNSNEKSYSIGIYLGAEPEGITYHYKLNYNLKDADVDIGDYFRVRRDSLVAHGILSTPYTDTQEYKDLLKSEILYWTGSKWVQRKDLK